MIAVIYVFRLVELLALAISGWKAQKASGLYLLVFVFLIVLFFLLFVSFVLLCFVVCLFVCLLACLFVCFFVCLLYFRPTPTPSQTCMPNWHWSQSRDTYHSHVRAVPHESHVFVIHLYTASHVQGCGFGSQRACLWLYQNQAT